jgi:mono/diheme cytochrome c family protein
MPMNGKRLLAAAMAAVAVGAVSVATLAAAAGKPEASRVVARGRYLVEQVGMCTDCHSPRNQKGELIRERWLQGAPLEFKNTVPMPKWADAAPPLAGLPGWTEAQVVTLLTTGKDQKGEPPDPPMPAYRMSKEDATAVAAYLASLGKK